MKRYLKFIAGQLSSANMHLGEISFCDKIGFNIKSDDTKKKILDELDTLCSFKVIQKHYEKYNENSLQVLNKNPHMISVRTNGNPYLLYLTRHNFTNQCIFIDKKIQHGYYYPRMIIGKFWFSDSLFNNTLLDGEMVKTNDGSWVYIINDIITYNRTLLSTYNLVKRIGVLNDILTNMYHHDPLNTCRLAIKRYFYYNEVNTMIEQFIPSLPYSCRGLYFKPLYLKFRDILLNFDDSLIQKVTRTKYKNVSTFLLKKDMVIDAKQALLMPPPPPLQQRSTIHHSITSDAKTDRQFYAKKTSQPDIFELYAESDSKEYEIACINTMAASRLMKEIFQNANPNDKFKVLCKFHEKFQKWVPIQEVK